MNMPTAGRDANLEEEMSRGCVQGPGNVWGGECSAGLSGRISGEHHSLPVVVMVCATVVNTQTHRDRESFWLSTALAHAPELQSILFMQPHSHSTKSSQFISQLCKIQLKNNKTIMKHSRWVPEEANTLI